MQLLNLNDFQFDVYGLGIILYYIPLSICYVLPGAWNDDSVDLGNKT